MSQPPNTRSLRSLSGTNFLISGERPSVRFPRRMVLSCVSEPTGCALPLRTNSTPAMKVVLTAPIPGNSTPNLPFGGAIFPGFSIPLLFEPGSRLHALGRQDLLSIKDGFSLTARTNARPFAAPQVGTEQASNDARTPPVLQTIGRKLKLHWVPPRRRLPPDRFRWQADTANVVHRC